MHGWSGTSAVAQSPGEPGILRGMARILHLSADQLCSDLESAQARIEQLQGELAAAEARARDLAALIRLTERLYPEASAAEVPASAPVRKVVSTLDTKVAALAVLKDTTPKAWKVEALAQEMLRRGWVPEASQSPHLLVASAMSRLMRSGESGISRPRYGHYSWTAPVTSSDADGDALASVHLDQYEPWLDPSGPAP